MSLKSPVARWLQMAHFDLQVREAPKGLWVYFTLPSWEPELSPSLGAVTITSPGFSEHLWSRHCSSVQHLWTHLIFSITRCDRHQNLTLHVRRLRSNPQGGSGCGCARSEDSVRGACTQQLFCVSHRNSMLQKAIYVPAILEKMYPNFTSVHHIPTCISQSSREKEPIGCALGLWRSNDGRVGRGVGQDWKREPAGLEPQAGTWSHVRSSEVLLQRRLRARSLSYVIYFHVWRIKEK